MQIRSQQTSLREKTGNKDTTKQNFHLSFYLPSVAEVYNIHVALLDVPLEVLRTVFFLQVNSEDYLLILPVSLQCSKPLLKNKKNPAQNFNMSPKDIVLAITRPLQTDNKPPGLSTLSLIFITHIWDADSPAANAPHLI